MLFDFVSDYGVRTILVGGLPAFGFVGEVLGEVTWHGECLVWSAADLEHLAEGPFVGIEFLLFGVAERNQVVCLLNQIGSLTTGQFADPNGVGQAATAVAEFHVSDLVSDDETDNQPIYSASR